MEGDHITALDPVLQTARDDISSSIERKKTLMALVPLDDFTLGSFLHHVIRVSRLNRKRVLFLCPQRQIARLRAISRSLMGTISPDATLAAIDPDDLVCLSEGFKVGSNEISHYCYTDDCHRSCPYQSGFSLDLYRRIKEASGSLEGMDREMFSDIGMCPAHTLMDIASESSVLIFDHSLLVAPGMDGTISQMGVDPAETILSIMDPVSLVDEVWDVHSQTLTPPMLQTSFWPFQGMSEKELNAMETLFQVLRGMIDHNRNESSIDRKQLIDDLRTEMRETGLTYSITDIIHLLSGASSGGSDISFSDRIKLRYLERFLKLWFEQHSTVSRYVLSERERSINLSLIAPQVVISPITTAFHSSVVFGDNIYPHDIIARMLGLPLNRVNNRTYISARNMKDITVISFTNVDLTSRSEMDEQYGTVAKNIELITRALKGRSLIVFPSYNALEGCVPLMSGIRDLRPVLEESRHSSKDDKERLLGEFMTTEDCIGVDVQNGVLARAFESGGVDVRTSVMVGLQFNPPSPESNQKKIFFHDNYGSNAGELISRVLPAMQKTMRMVNAQMYAGEGRRFVILMDRRYQDRRNVSAIPPFWDIKFISDPKNLRFDLLLEG